MRMKADCEGFSMDLEKNRKVLEEARQTAQVLISYLGRGLGGEGA